ncbi:MAG: uroporphyrinogen decarboxylase [Candidatus Pelagibacter sp. TMED263]|nr:MAG: uroporphyrinogen decarboxylase [Candidatus Pelagibacter sp. TMED263]
MSTLRKILIDKQKSCKSVWFMRQAGRYLPEFRKIRSQNQNFIKLCLNSKLSSEITLQPIKRFNLDSAIIFSDILMTPYSLGQEIEFKKDEGPKLNNFNLERFLDTNEIEFSRKLQPVYKAIETTRISLDKNKSLIGFIGAPWTLLIYMFDIKKNKNEIDLNKLHENDINIKKILEKLIKFLCVHINNQISAGADVIQIFDSWAGLVPENNIKDYCYIPNAKIVEFCKKEKIPNICFPKGINKKYKDFNETVKPDGLNLDYDIDPMWAKNKLKNVVLQGGLDPKLLLKSEEEMLKGATKYIQSFKDIPYIFNLGHGLLPETDPDRVKKLIDLYRNY